MFLDLEYDMRLASLVVLFVCTIVFGNGAVPTDHYTKYSVPRYLGDNKWQPGVHSKGSGTVVRVFADKHWVVTCAHCVKEREAGTHFYTAATKKAQVLVRDEKTDLALLEVEGGGKALQLETADLKRGDVVTFTGFSSGNAVQRTGVVAGTNTVDGVPGFELSVGADHGDSGAGVFKDKKLAGVVWGGRTNAQVVPAQFVKELLQKVEKLSPAKNVLPPATREKIIVLPSGTTRIQVDLTKLYSRLVRVDDRYYEVSVKEVKPEAIKVMPKEDKKGAPPVKE